MPDGVQSMPVVLSQTPSVEKVQDVDLRVSQYLQQAAAEADQAQVARSRSQIEPSDRSRTGRRVSEEGGTAVGGQRGRQGQAETYSRRLLTKPPAGERPRPGGIVDVVV
jgi:Ni/Co efflux regulator RcnB